MGAVASLFDPAEVDDPSLGNYDRPYFEYFGMNKFDVSVLVQLYKKLGKNKKGRVNVKTILSKFGVSRSPFMERVFSLLCLQSIKQKASVDYKTFIYLMWNFLSIGLNLPALAMSIYDIQRTKRLSREDIYDMMKDIHGWKLEQHHHELTKAIRQIEGKGLNLSEFEVFVLKMKLAFEPIQKVFEKMQFKTLGKSRWNALSMKRQTRWEGRFVDIYTILADMKEETHCPDDIITLDQFKIQIDKNIKYIATVEENKKAKNKKTEETKEDNEKDK